MGVSDTLKKLFGGVTSDIPASPQPSGEVWGPNPYGMPEGMPRNFGVTDHFDKGTADYGPVAGLDTTHKDFGVPSTSTKTSSVPPKLAAVAATPQPKLSLAAAATPQAPTMSAPNDSRDLDGVTSSTPTSDQLPSLTPQGGTHAIPSALLRLIGITAADPKPGQLYAGPTTPDAKMKAGVGFAGRLGNAFAAAAGTPAQQELAEKRSEFGPELKQKGDLARATLDSLSDYRQGRVQNAADQVGINQQKADQVQQQNIAKNRALGRVPDENNPGVYRGMTPDEILTDPVLSKKQDLAQAAALQKNAETALAQARTDALVHSDSPTLALKARQIEATLEMAKANLVLRQHALSNQDSGLALRRHEAVLNYGSDDLGNTLTKDNAAPFMATDDTGNPVPLKQSGPFRPTTGARTKGEQAQTIVDSGEQLVNDIKQHADEIGPLASRYNDVLSFIGDPPPEYKGLAAELESWIALHPAAHGFRGMNAVQEFQKAFGPIQMTPEALIAGIRGSYNTMGALERTATPKTTGPAKGSANAPASGANAKGALSIDEARQYLQKAGGDKDKARALAKQDGRSF